MGTPDVNYTYDRLGQPLQVTGATTNDYIFTAQGLLVSENVVNKSWNYASQNRPGYDALLRRSGLTNLTLSLVQNYGYDAASCYQTISTLDAGLSTSVGYGYLSNSPLVSELYTTNQCTERATSFLHWRSFSATNPSQ